MKRVKMSSWPGMVSSMVCLVIFLTNCSNHSSNQGNGSNPIIDTGTHSIAGNGTGNVTTAVNTTGENPTHTLGEDSISIPVFAFWTDKATGGKFDGLYDSITSLFKYCEANKTQKVNSNEVTIDELNKCSKMGQMTPLWCVIKLDNKSQFCNILALDSTNNKLLILNSKNDTIVASMHKFSPVEKQKIKIKLYQPSANLQQMRTMEPLLKNDNIKEQRFIIHKSFARLPK